MKLFNSPGKFAAHLAKLVATEVAAVEQGLEKAAKLVEKTAKAEMGQYQPQIGGFPAWAPLADSTIDDRIRKGFNPDDPLLRTGETRDSISYQRKKLEAVVGSTSQLMVYFEFGTVKMPMRPVLGPAVFRQKKKIQKIMGIAAVSGLIGAEKIHSALGYDFEV